MKRFLTLLLASLITFDIAAPAVRAEEPATSETTMSDTASPSEDASEAAPREIPSDQGQWRQKLDEMKTQRNILLGLGSVGAAAGAVMAISGYSEASDAGSTPGCTQTDTFTITCTSEKSRQEAQDKLDSGRGKMVTGLLVGGVGAVALIAGFLKGDKVNAWEAEGKKKGFTVGLTTTDGRDIVLAAAYRF
jgi:hypothetical protein